LGKGTGFEKLDRIAETLALKSDKNSNYYQKGSGKDKNIDIHTGNMATSKKKRNSRDSKVINPLPTNASKQGSRNPGSWKDIAPIERHVRGMLWAKVEKNKTVVSEPSDVTGGKLWAGAKKQLVRKKIVLPKKDYVKSDKENDG
jgi:hypothetical protein